jgi:hypothetical protein
MPGPFRHKAYIIKTISDLDCVGEFLILSLMWCLYMKSNIGEGELNPDTL